MDSSMAGAGIGGAESTGFAARRWAARAGAADTFISSLTLLSITLGSGSIAGFAASCMFNPCTLRSSSDFAPAPTASLTAEVGAFSAILFAVCWKAGSAPIVVSLRGASGAPPFNPIASCWPAVSARTLAASVAFCAILALDAAGRPVRRTVAPRTTSRRAAAATTGNSRGHRRIRGRRLVPDAARIVLMRSSKPIGAVCGANPRYKTSMRLTRSSSRKHSEHCVRCASTALRCSGASSPSINAENSSRTSPHSIATPHSTAKFSRRSRSILRAWLIRDFTVPVGHPSASAISS